ncbi:serine/threonine protein kinase [Arthrobacter crystallopoietes BAB-32]|uniref:non-specific serine/threonine protein kinase n=1 Tax=Arthrobacter crystallopoietes BAB-32 TaxID=1246476 RepID=N1V1B2_9MICC|nr:serine/threonine-protein kinase [Arthrobacter crystallopoietes]EMY35130.1 serine/threonine protein kinase [Arthrobacter crystallopoietes BAB-32]
MNQALPVSLGGRYRLQGLIGRGGSAAVYRALDEVLDRQVAVKVFRPDVSDDDELRRQQAEIHLLATFNHPGLIAVFDAGREENSLGEACAFVVMELAPGSDLRQRLRAGALPAAEVAVIGCQLAGALHYVHQRGVIHRDLKPANIMLGFNVETGEARAKLTDFGIARVIEGTRLTATGKTVGTATYLSPEQAKGEALSTSSDIYSLGLVLLECLTGHVEFPGSPVESAVARLQRAPVIPPWLSADWADLLSGMTAMDPAARPDAGAVEAALAEMQGATPTTAVNAVPPPADVPPARTRPGRARSSRSRSRAALWLAAALLVIIAAVVAVLLLMSNSRQEPPPVPEPSPALTGELEEHMRELERSLVP